MKSWELLNTVNYMQVTIKICQRLLLNASQNKPLVHFNFNQEPGLPPTMTPPAATAASPDSARRSGTSPPGKPKLEAHFCRSWTQLTLESCFVVFFPGTLFSVSVLSF